jgi:hypothetical protein
MADTAEFYRARAAEEHDRADEALLDNVRDRCLRAEAAWIAMAVRAERTATLRASREAPAILEAMLIEPALH